MDSDSASDKAQVLEEAIRLGTPVSFRSRLPDGRLSSRHLIYPREILDQNGHLYVQAGSHTSADLRMYRLDRMHALQWAKSSPPWSFSGVTGMLVGVVLIVCAAGWVIWTFSGGHPEEGPVLVTAVVDGDTIYVGRGWRRTKVRLIGVDTPETVHPRKPEECFGLEAKYFTQLRLEDQLVQLRFKPDERTDRYGRTLAYVYLEDGSLLNLELIELGFGRAYTRFPFQYHHRFTQAEREARLDQRGLWKACVGSRP